MECLELIENKILEAIRKTYVANKVRFATDPDANDIISVELFDIPDAECRNVKKYLWDVIEENCPDNVYSFVPAVYSHSKTAAFYADYCLNLSSNALEDGVDYTGFLSDDIMAILADRGENCVELNLAAPEYEDYLGIQQPETRHLIETLGREKEVCNNVHYGLAA